LTSPCQEWFELSLGDAHHRQLGDKVWEHADVDKAVSGDIKALLADLATIELNAGSCRGERIDDARGMHIGRGIPSRAGIWQGLGQSRRVGFLPPVTV